MKYFKLGSGHPADEIDKAKLLGADLALAEKSGVLTVVYPLSDGAVQRFSDLGVKEIESSLIHRPAYIVIFRVDEAIAYLRNRYCLELEPVSISQKTP